MAPLLVSRTVSESDAASVTHSSVVCVGCQASAVGCKSGTFSKGTTVRAWPSAAAHPAAVAETGGGEGGEGGEGGNRSGGEGGEGSEGGGGLHASMPASTPAGHASRPPTCAHVMPRHEYVCSSAALTAAVSGFVPEINKPEVWS